MVTDFKPLQILRGTRDPEVGMLGFVVLLVAVSVLSVTTANECHSFFAVHHIAVSFTPSLLFGVVTWFWWLLLASAMWIYSGKASLGFSWKSLATQAAIALPAAFVHITLLQALVRVLSTHWRAWGTIYSGYRVGTGQRFGVELMIYGFMYAAVSMVSLQRSSQQATIRGLILERQLSDAQLQALQMQMEPHFLFNTLNAIASLVTQKRNVEANETLDHLNTILRATLRNAPAKKILFHEEVKVVESFLAIQQIRFPEHLKISLSVSADTLDGLVPPFILQPLIENAVLHGVAAADSRGVIETSAYRRGDMLHLRVWNSVSSENSPQHKGHGIGQTNTCERLRRFYPGKHDFRAGHLADGTYEVNIVIPFETITL